LGAAYAAAFFLQVKRGQRPKKIKKVQRAVGAGAALEFSFWQISGAWAGNNDPENRAMPRNLRREKQCFLVNAAIAAFFPSQNKTQTRLITSRWVCAFAYLD
jgi:hypothetical protein